MSLPPTTSKGCGTESKSPRVIRRQHEEEEVQIVQAVQSPIKSGVVQTPPVSPPRPRGGETNWFERLEPFERLERFQLMKHSPSRPFILRPVATLADGSDSTRRHRGPICNCCLGTGRVDYPTSSGDFFPERARCHASGVTAPARETVGRWA